MLTRNLDRTQPWGPFSFGTPAAEKARTPERGGCTGDWAATKGSAPEAGGGVEPVPVDVGLFGVESSFEGGVVGGVTSTTTVFEVSETGEPSPAGGVPVRV